MKVILCPSGGESFQPVLLCNAADIGPEPLLNFRHDGLAPVLCGEDAVKQ